MEQARAIISLRYGLSRIKIDALPNVLNQTMLSLHPFGQEYAKQSETPRRVVV